MRAALVFCALLAVAVPAAADISLPIENWSIEETRLEPLLVRFDMKMNRFYSGGAGEARLVFERRAQAIVRAGDYYSYQIVDYKESLNSFLFGGQRIVEGTIRLIPKI